MKNKYFKAWLHVMAWLALSAVYKWITTPEVSNFMAITVIGIGYIISMIATERK